MKEKQRVRCGLASNPPLRPPKVRVLVEVRCQGSPKEADRAPQTTSASGDVG